MITFNNIKWKNFLSYGNYYSEIKLDKNNNTLLTGKNGSGKSTLEEALCFSLFNKPFRNINKPQLCNSINKKNCEVEVNFTIGNNKYKVIRGIKPNIFKIYENDKLKEQDASDLDYQKYLEQAILKMNYKSFTQIVILGSASFTPFMQLKASDRREIIEDLLDIQIFTTMNAIIKTKLDKNKTNIQHKKHELDKLNNALILHQKHLNDLKQNNTDEINKYKLEVVDNINIINNLNDTVNTRLIEVDKLQNSILHKIETEKKLTEITKLESKLETKLYKSKQDKSFFQSNDSCPTCHQIIDLQFKTNKITDINHKIVEYQDGLEYAEKLLLKEQDKLNKITDIQKQIQKIQIGIAKDETSIRERNNYINKLNNRIETLKTSKVIDNKQYIDLVEVNNNITIETNNYKELLDEKMYLDSIALLLKDTGIKTKIILQYLPIINTIINKYLNHFDFFINFNLDESLKEIIKSRYRDEFSYSCFSEGEKAKIDVSLMLAWREVAKLKNSVNTNLLILDETFDASLDNNGIEYLMMILNKLENINLIVISHKGDVLQDKFTNTIRFIKDRDFSRILYD